MNLQQLTRRSPDPALLRDQIRESPSAQIVLNYLRATVPDLPGSAVDIPQTTYSLYRQFALTGERAGYETCFFAKRAMLTRAVLEMILGEAGMADVIHDLLWSICEETSWVLPAHEEPGERFDSLDGTEAWPSGSNSSLTREPDLIDLFAAETGASLAETVFLLGDRLAPEVVQRVRQEVERHVFRPYLAYGRKYWWHKGDMNWNAVCNGAVGLAFVRLEKDPRRLAEALVMVLEGFEAYLATGFEADGGSLEGVSYWNYGLFYYVALAELLREQTGGRLDLLAAPRMRDIARFPLGMALSPGQYINFSDATEQIGLQPGIVQRLAERTGLDALRGLITSPGNQAAYGIAALPITLRDVAWWDGQRGPFPAVARQDFYLPACAVIKLTGQTVQGRPVILAAKAGRNTGHHYHLDIAHFTVHIDGENLLCDPGRGLYTREYFRDQRFQNIFCNSFGHSVPRIGGRQQMPGPKFGSGPLVEGKFVEHSLDGSEKFAVIDFAALYGLPELTLARRTLRLVAGTGEIQLEDAFEFSGSPLEIEEAFVTWYPVAVSGSTARITGNHSELSLIIQEPTGCSFTATLLTEACRANRKKDVLTRLSANLPAGTQRFILKLIPTHRP
jgi:hypothetical protein